MVVEPRMKLLGLCFFDAAEKADFCFLAPKNGGFSERLEKRKKPPQNIFGGRKIFLASRKSYLAAEHHNEAAPKKKRKNEVFPLGRRKILLRRRPPKKPIFGFGPRKKLLVAENVFGGVEKVISPPNTITRRRRK